MIVKNSEGQTFRLCINPSRTLRTNLLQLFVTTFFFVCFVIRLARAARASPKSGRALNKLSKKVVESKGVLSYKLKTCTL